MKDKVTAKDIAFILGVSRNTVFNMVTRGELPDYKKIGGRYYWDKKEIEEFIKSFIG